MILDPNQTLSEIFNTNGPIEAEMVKTDETSLVPAASAELVPVEDISPEEVAAKEDFDYSRKSLKEIGDISKTGLENALNLANSLDRPAGFEAVANMVKATIEAHRALQELHKSSSEIRMAAKAANPQTNQVNVEKGIVFAGTAEDLLRMIDTSRS